MKNDKFLKIILTVIAVNLTILTFINLDVIPKSYAHETAKDFTLKSEQSYGLIPINEDGSITVQLSTRDEIDVNIVGVNTYDELDVNISGIETSDELDVNIDEVGGGYISHGGPIPVEIE